MKCTCGGYGHGCHQSLDLDSFGHSQMFDPDHNSFPKVVPEEPKPSWADKVIHFFATLAVVAIIWMVLSALCGIGQEVP